MKQSLKRRNMLHRLFGGLALALSRRFYQIRHMSWITLDETGGLVYRKEVIYEGDWVKADQGGQGISFSTARDVLNHWADSVNEFKKDGILIPFSLGHENWQDTENKLGEVVAAHVGENGDGRPSLLVDVAFDSVEARDKAIKADVSLGSPAEFTDGTGKKWFYPIRHIASTAAPVIPGLETWQAIAASFDKQEQPDMSLSEIASKFELNVGDDPTVDSVADALQSKFDELQKAVDAATPPEPVELSESEKGLHEMMINTVADNLKGRIDGCVAQGKLAPAVAKRIKDVHCSKKAVEVELAHGTNGEMFNHVLDIALAASESQPLKPSGRHEDAPDDAIVLDHKESKGQSLVESMKAFAEKRQAELDAQRRRV